MLKLSRLPLNFWRNDCQTGDGSTGDDGCPRHQLSVDGGPGRAIHAKGLGHAEHYGSAAAG